MGKRIPRLEEALLREVSQCLQNQIRDPRLGFVTISQVKLSDDLAYATFYMSAYGTEKEKAQSLAVANKSAAFIRSYLAKNLHTRTVPKITFKLDNNLDHADRIGKLLLEVDLGKENKPETPS